MELFLTRRPVFDRNYNVFAYDLLFQSDFSNLYANPDWSAANNTALALNLISNNIETVTRGKQGFISFSENMLLQDIHKRFPDNNIAVALNHPDELQEPLVAACKQIRAAGNPIVLDITAISSPVAELLELSSMVKIDISAGQSTKILNGHHNADLKVLAVNIDNHDDFKYAVEAGCHYFEGDFYCRPEHKGENSIPFQNMNHLLLLQEINHPDISFDRLSSIIRRDVGLSYKLMRYINSAYFGFAQDVTSLRYALALLGIFNIKKWLSKETLHSVGQDKPDELVVSSLVRARFCELLCQKTKLQDRASEMFLTGLFSRLDAFLNEDLPTVLQQLPLTDDIKWTLTGEPSVFGDLYQLILSYEQGDWAQVRSLAGITGVRVSDLPLLFIQSLEWSHHLFCE